MVQYLYKPACECFSFDDVLFNTLTGAALGSFVKIMLGFFWRANCILKSLISLSVLKVAVIIIIIFYYYYSVRTAV